jgi:hypothetical protein
MIGVLKVEALNLLAPMKRLVPSRPDEFEGVAFRRLSFYDRCTQTVKAGHGQRPRQIARQRDYPELIERLH